MVNERLELDVDVQEIFNCIDKNQNFLLSGGAGSGKTYSLVQVIRQLIKEHPVSKIACMTYTNAAVKEIEERVNHKNLRVSTFHDFLWDNIKQFQNELKISLINLANNKDIARIKIEDNPISNNYFDNLEKGIQYKEYLKLKDGIISHDELLIIANFLFKNYPKLSDIIKDRYKYILIDEYQDTNKLVIDIFLKYFKNSKKLNTIGFFGDAMQSIYDTGIGNLDDYKGEGALFVKEIKKTQNRRNPQLIIDLANQLRTDGLIQKPSKDSNAPNMINGKIKQGAIKFFYSNDDNANNVKATLSKEYQWDFSNTKETKELNLTHNLIADKAGFRNLMTIYDKDGILEYKNRIRKHIKKHNITNDFSDKTFEEVIEILKKDKSGKELNAILPTKGMQIFIDKNLALFNNALKLNYSIFSKIYIDSDQLLDNKKQDHLIQHLFKIQKNIALYRNKQYNEFIRKTEYKITSIKAKKRLKENIDSLTNVGNKTIEQIIEEANSKGISLIDDKVTQFKEEKAYIYNRLKDIKYNEFQKLFEYIEGKTPFSTQHKTKGAEFDKILVIMDKGKWNNYNFEYLFNPEGCLAELELQKSKNKSKIQSFPNVLSRSQKIFYVCCTRAKEKLVVYFHSPKAEIIAKAIEWFGRENVIEI